MAGAERDGATLSGMRPTSDPRRPRTYASVQSKVAFDYRVDGDSRHSRLYFFIDGLSQGNYNNEGNWTHVEYDIIAHNEATTGTHQLTWTFNRNDDAMETPHTRVLVRNVKVYSALDGLAEACSNCPSGHFSDEDGSQVCSSLLSLLSVISRSVLPIPSYPLFKLQARLCMS